MTPTKLINHIINRKNLFILLQTITLTILAVAFILLDKFYIEEDVRVIFYIAYVIGYLGVIFLWRAINYRFDVKIQAEVYQRIDEETSELAEALMENRIYKNSNIIPILKKIIEKYGDQLDDTK